MPTLYSKQKPLKENISELHQNWKWILSFTKGHRGGMICVTLLGIFASGMTLVTALNSKALIDAISIRDTTRLIPCILLLLLSGILSTAAGAISNRLSAKLQIRIQNRIHGHIFESLLSSQWQEVLNFPTGDLINRFSADIHTLGSCAFNWLPKVLIQCFTAAASLAVVAWFDPLMALIFCFSIPVLVLTSHKLFQKIQHHNRQIRQFSSDLTSFESEVLRNFDTLKSFSAEANLRTGLEYHMNNLRQASLQHNLFSIQTNLWMNAMGTALQYLTLGYCLLRLWNGQLQWGTLVLFLQQHAALSAAFSSLISLVPSALSGSVAAERLRELTDLKKEPAQAPITFQSCTLRCDHVTAGYKTKPNVLKDISLSVSPGETIALIGPSGEGKTTLLRLFLALIPPTEGNLTLIAEDGTIHPISPATRSCFTYVPQGNTVMAASIADNLRLANPNATHNEMKTALTAACAWSFVEPLGLDAKINEGGKGLSQGQSQRLSIARALLRSAPILLLDEATSDLDPDTEQEILQNIKSLNKTCILTTHRPSVWDQSDRIYQIENGFLKQIK